MWKLIKGFQIPRPNSKHRFIRRSKVDIRWLPLVRYKYSITFASRHAVCRQTSEQISHWLTWARNLLSRSYIWILICLYNINFDRQKKWKRGWLSFMWATRQRFVFGEKARWIGGWWQSNLLYCWDLYSQYPVRPQDSCNSAYQHNSPIP